MRDLFKEFPKEREEGLKRIYRYSAFEVMLYRPNLFTHVQRVSWLVEELTPVAQKYFEGFDGEKARLLAFVHDDPELITGDIQSRVKVRSSKQAVEQMHDDEAKAIKELAQRFPKNVGSYSYEALLTETLKRTTVESEVATYADKLDGYCESMHEVFAGNFAYLQCVIFYAKAMGRFEHTFPRLKGLLADKTSPLTDLDRHLDVQHISHELYASFNKPFTEGTIVLPSTFQFYDFWREMIIRKGGEEGMRTLVQQREFLPKK